ncbi:hypothetical protein [Nocardia sp. NPDC050175]|uniref:hypothetical protein n=1 Tax=Nocardia sp. NPDC050175 TaxID=3364317 RepID=UPI0037ABB90F
MLSIRFGDDREWWASGSIFDRLFAAGLRSEVIPPELAEMQHLANANGGLDFGLLDAKQAAELTIAIRDAARQEITELASLSLCPDDQSYLARLTRLLEVVPPHAE